MISNSHNWGGDFALYIHQFKGILKGNVTEVAALNAFAGVSQKRCKWISYKN